MAARKYIVDRSKQSRVDAAQKPEQVSQRWDCFQRSALPTFYARRRLEQENSENMVPVWMQCISGR